MIDALTAADHLVGNLYFNFGALPVVASKLHPEDLPDGPGKTVYREMCRLYMSPDEAFSAGTLEGALRSVNFDFGYLGDLQSRIVPESTEALEEYAEVINNYADLRDLELVLREAGAQLGDANATAQQLIPSIMERLTTVRRANNDTVKPLAEVLDGVRSDLQKWRGGEVEEGLRYGFADLDKIVRLTPGELTLVAARPSMGKTSFAMQVAENVARDPEPGCVMIFSAEMTGKSLGHRMVAARSGVNAHRLRTGIADPDEYDKALRAADELSSLGIMIDDSSSISTEQMYYRVAMMNARIPVKLVVFDFVELGADQPGRRSDGEEQRISQIARGLKKIAKNINVPVLALSQLNREVDKRQDKLPTLSDLRYSGMLEQVSDVVLFLMRPEYYISRNDRCFLDEKEGSPDLLAAHPHAQGVAYALVSKHRNGPIGKVNLAFISKYTKFADLERHYLNEEPF